MARPKTPEKHKRQVVNLSCSQYESKFLKEIQNSGRNQSHFMLKTLYKTHEFKDFLKRHNLTLEDMHIGKHKSFFEWELKTDREVIEEYWQSKK
jgi:hypothetical protein